MLGVPVGKIVSIEPLPQRARITFWVDDKYKVPADVKAVILSPELITARSIALTPMYTSGPTLPSGAVIAQDRTAVPVEWDDVRAQLQKLADALQPTQPGGTSPLGDVINTAANNLRGQGASIRDAIIKLSQALSALGDHSNDIFTTLKNLSTLVSALRDSSDLMRRLNTNLASVTGLLANDPNEVGQVVDDLNSASAKVKDFVAENREALGTTSDKLAGITTAVNESLDDIKQTLHVAPTAFQNFINIYEPAHASLDGRAGTEQLRQPDLVPVRSNSGGVAAERRAVGEVMRAIPRPDHQEPAVQLPAVRGEPPRRCHGATQRDHLQRGLDATGLQPRRTPGAGRAAARGRTAPTRRRARAARACTCRRGAKPAAESGPGSIPAPAPRPLRRTPRPPTRPRACPESWFRTEPGHDPAMVADRMGAAAGGDPAVDVGLRLAGPELAANARNSGRRARLVRRAGPDA